MPNSCEAVIQGANLSLAEYSSALPLKGLAGYEFFKGKGSMKKYRRNEDDFYHADEVKP